MKVAKCKGEPEIFFSFQGEGKTAGKPAVFLRLSQCNLSCSWCDTPYTWNWKQFDRREETTDISVEEIAKRVTGYPCKHVVITGGEPMLQQKELCLLMRLLKPKGYTFEVETNMTLLPIPEFDNRVDQYNCSPKLKGSGIVKKRREVKDVFEFFSRHKKTYFKFVISNEEDLKELLLWVEHYAFPRERIYLMAEGGSPKDLQEKEKRVVEMCKKESFCFTDRLHIKLYGSRRGV